MVYLGTNRLNDRWLGINLLGDKKMFPGLLDTYPATATYSAGRRLKSDQTYAMTIRRESDNAELDIGFDANGDTDQAAISSFCGASDCFVTTLYDASGNGNHTTQSVATNQPKIYDVETTSVVTENGKPALEWPNYTNNVKLGADVGLLTVGESFVVASSSNLGSFSSNYSGIITAFINVSSDNSGIVLIGSRATTLNVYSVDKIWDSLWLNGQDAETTPNIFPVFPTIENQTLLNTFQPTSKTINGVLVGGDRNVNERGWQGTIQEVIVFDSNQSANRTNIENNINNYYGIY